MFFPSPSRLKSFFHRSLSFPSHFFLCQCRIAPDGNYITWTSRSELVIQFEMIDLFECGDKFQNRRRAASTDVEDFVIFFHLPVQHPSDSVYVSFSQINYVDVV